MTRLSHQPWMDWPETKTLVRTFADANTEMRFVGGAVRDSLLLRPVHEVDIATPATPDAVTVLLARAKIRAIPTGIEHGTVTALVGEKHFEITTLRRDVACDGRHAEVEYTTDWEADARRRDFTINALFASPAGEVFDYCGGLKHLQPPRIVFIGDAGARIKEDALRILRFFRFSAQLGVHEYDADALAACAENVTLIERLSGERTREEMLKLLAAPALDKTLFTHLQRAGLPPHLLLPPPPAALTHAALDADAPARLALWLMHGGDAKALAKRWKFSGAQQKTLQSLMHTAERLRNMPAVPQLKKLLRAEGVELFSRAARIAWALDPSLEHFYAQALILAEHWHIPQFPVTGEDLLKHGYEEGKALGAALKKLEAHWEAEDYQPTREELLKYL